MIRHPSNSNLTLHYENTFRGLPIQADKGPFVVEYLEKLYQTIARAVNHYSRVFAFRFDLRLPSDMASVGLTYENEVIDRFIESFIALSKQGSRVPLL